MKCANCGAEIKEGRIYCPVCGYERQIVPDYNLFEEDILTHILETNTQGTQNQTAPKQHQGNRSGKSPDMQRHPETSRKEQVRTVQNRQEASHALEPKKHSEHSAPRENIRRQEHSTAKSNATKVPEKAKKKSRIGLIVGIASVGAVLALGLMFGLMSYNNKHSFTYQYNKGLACEASGDYVEALTYFEKALEINPDNLDIRFEIADVYLSMEKEDKAISVLQKILELDSDNKNAYKKLISIYEEQGDTDAILALYQTAENDAILALFSAYEVEAPEISKKSGTYDENLSISLTSSDDAKIYYTLDGSSPEDYGILYQEPILFDEEGDYEITAVCESENGIYSESVSREYTIHYEIPDSPTAIPSEGTFNGEGQMITIQVPAGCNAYYIWNNPEDTSSWGRDEVVSRCTMYIEPIPMTPGNNILEVFTVSPKGKISKSIKCNYIYNP